MKSKVLALVLVFSLLACSGNLIAKERRGAELVVQKKDGKQIKGELIAVKPASLLILGAQSGADLAVDIADIRLIKLEKGLTFFSGLTLGAIAGLAGGFVAGLVLHESLDYPGIYMALIGAGIGGAVGSALGIVMGGEETIQIEGKSPEQIKADLKKLRKQARITNFQ